MNTTLQGKRILLIEMNDPRPIESGTKGTIAFTDDMGHIHVKWDNGRSLAVLPGIDKYEILENENK